jgi:hypothetical protein
MSTSETTNSGSSMATLVDSQFFSLLSEDEYLFPERQSPQTSLQRRKGGLTQDHLEPIAVRNWKRVLSWIAFEPDQITELADREGQTALHHACLFRAPANVVEAMLYASPELASARNDQGELALHWAVRLALPMEILKALLTANPSGGFTLDKEGHSPLSLLWDRHDDTLMQIYRVFGKERVLSSPQWKRIMLVVKSDSDQERDLHAIASTPCPSSLLRFAAVACKEDISVKDANGRLPLALCATSCAVDEETAWISVTILLDIYPQAAGIPDASGLLPLHLAIEKNRTWEGGVKALWRAEPRSLCTRDPSTKLYPFMLAASADSDISTIFRLLLAAPECVRLMM